MAPDLGCVSVILIFLNEERFLEEAIASVYAQSYASWELLLVDDGSADASSEIAKRHAARDPARVRYLEHPGHENRGMSATRNLGIAAACGEFIAFLDGDDVWLRERLRRGVELLGEHTTADMIYGKTQYWYSWSSDQPQRTDWIQPHGFRANRVIRAPQLLIMHLLNEASLPCMGSLTVRREAIRASGGFVDTFRGLYEDQAFLARFCLHHDVFVADENWDCYRQHLASACATADMRGDMIPARGAYMSWLTTYLDEQGMRSTRVWDALSFATKAGKYQRAGWRARLARSALRASARMTMAMRPARLARDKA